MKNKNKKIIKGIAVGAIACLGVGLFSGCEMSEAQVEKYDNEIVETKELLQTQIDELKKQNSKLNEQNSALEDLNESLEEQNELLEEQNQILKDENLKITDEQVYDILKMTEATFMANVNGVRDNLQITGGWISSYDEEETISVGLYKTESNGYVVYEKSDINEMSALTYKSNGKIYRYSMHSDRIFIEQMYRKHILLLSLLDMLILCLRGILY